MFNFQEVDRGYNKEQATAEAGRCLNCPSAPCKAGCPVGVKIPEFITELKKGEVNRAKEIIEETNSLGSICGRVCPQERQCQAKCVLGRKGEPIQIGQLERYAVDSEQLTIDSNNQKLPAANCQLSVAIIGSGPAGLACAGELIKNGANITIYEALHEFGGVLSYGIPEFRLPKRVVKKQIDDLAQKGVKFIKNAVIGKSISLQELQADNDFVFIGTGAGLPLFANIEGEMLNGVYSSNEFLTRVNLMHADDFPSSDTPVKTGKKVAVIGGGNVAMDCARVALRLNVDACDVGATVPGRPRAMETIAPTSPDVTLVYRRTIAEMPAREEEVRHALEEGVKMLELAIPKRIIGNENGEVVGLEVVGARLGAPDSSGRKSFEEIPNSNEILDVDTVIVAIGNKPNPLLTSSDSRLEVNKWGCLVADESGLVQINNAAGMPRAASPTHASGLSILSTDYCQLSPVYAGGDAVTGAATVIQAMGAGREAARAMLNSSK